MTYWGISVLTLHNIPHDLPTIFLYKNRMETISLLKRMLSCINLVALATRRTHILRFTLVLLHIVGVSLANKRQ